MHSIYCAFGISQDWPWSGYDHQMILLLLMRMHRLLMLTMMLRGHSMTVGRLLITWARQRMSDCRMYRVLLIILLGTSVSILLMLPLLRPHFFIKKILSVFRVSLKLFKRFAISIEITRNTIVVVQELFIANRFLRDKPG